MAPANRSVAGAIQLALNAAGHSDKTNMALSWMRDGCPPEVSLRPTGIPSNANVF